MNKVEKYIQDYTRRCSNELDHQENGSPTYAPWLTPDHAKAVAEIAREEVVKRACEWWKTEFSYPMMTEEERVWYKDKVNEFRKAMEEEK